VNRRRYLGRNFSRYERIYVYLIDNGLEVDVSEGYDIQRVRVFFEDIRLLTMHTGRSRIAATISGVLMLVALVISIVMWFHGGADSSSNYVVFSVLIWFILVPTLLYFLSCLRQRLSICVYGHRSKATMQWYWRHELGRAVFAELKAAITANQGEKRARLAQQQAQAPSAFGPPPEELQALDASGGIDPGPASSPPAEPGDPPAAAGGSIPGSTATPAAFGDDLPR